MAHNTSRTKRVEFFTILAAICAGCAFMATSVAAGDIVQPTGATAQSVESGQWGYYGPDLTTITGEEFVPAERGANVRITSLAANEMWIHPGYAAPAANWLTGPYTYSTTPQWIAWDLGAIYTVDGFHLWNGNCQNSRYATSAVMYVVSSLPANGDPLPASRTLVGSYTSMTTGPGPFSPINDSVPEDNVPSAYNYAGDNYNLISSTSGRYFLLNITGGAGGANSYVAINEIRFIKAPPMGVQGSGGIAITNGDMAPILGDGTDFGGVVLEEYLTHTFTITNTSTTNINLTGIPTVAIVGDAAFSVTNWPATPVSPGSSTTFQVAFAPTGSPGGRTAVISITNDTPGIYTFGLTGTATVVPAPTKLVYTIVPATGTSGIPFSVTVQAQDSTSTPSCPVHTTTITLTKATGAGSLRGTLTGTIGTDTNSVTIATPIYSKADVMTLTATATAGDTNLTPVTSSSISFWAGAAAKLAFTTQPGGGTAAVVWAIQPVVTVQDPDGNTATTDVSSVTLAIGTNPGGGTLGGTLTEAAVAGVADYNANALNINKSGTGYTLIATNGALASATSSVFNVIAGPVDAGRSTVSASPGEVQGDGITPATITVILRDSYDNPVEGKTVTLTSSRGSTDMITTNSGTTSASGEATFEARSSTLGVAVFTATDETDALTISPSTASVGFAPVTRIKPTGAKARLSNNVPYDGPIQTYTGLEFPLGQRGADVLLTSLCANEGNILGAFDGDYPAPIASWLTPSVPSVGAPQWIAWDLGATYTIDGFHLWNGNNQGDRYVRAADMYTIDAGTYGALVDNGDAAFNTNNGALVGSYSGMTTGPGPFSPVNDGYLANNPGFPESVYNYAGTNFNLTSPTNGRYFLMNITAAGIDSNNLAAINEIRFVNTPVIVVRGTNDAAIAFADVTPSVADGTDFGDVVLWRSLTHTFTIVNSSPDTIFLTGTPMVNVVGSADFSVTAQPAATNVVSGGSRTFQIAFSPTGSAGQIKTATVSIHNSCPLTPYTFDIKGTATGGTALIIR